MNRQDPHEFVRFAAGADYRHTCAECMNEWGHPMHGRVDQQPRKPERVGEDQPSAASVLACYANLMDVLDEYNTMVEDGDQVCIPITLQNVLADYIAEQEAIAILKGDAP